MNSWLRHCCLLQKVCASKTPSDLYNLIMRQCSCKERTNTTLVTKDWIFVGLAQIPNNALPVHQRRHSPRKNLHSFITSHLTDSPLLHQYIHKLGNLSTKSQIDGGYVFLELHNLRQNYDNSVHHTIF